MTGAMTALTKVNQDTEWEDLSIDGSGLTISGLQTRIAAYKTAITSVHEDSATVHNACQNQESYDNTLASKPTKQDLDDAKEAYLNYGFDDEDGTKGQELLDALNQVDRERTEAVAAHKTGTVDTRPEFKLNGTYKDDPFGGIPSPSGTPTNNGNPSDSGNPEGTPSDTEGDPTDGEGDGEEDTKGQTELSSDPNAAQAQTPQQQQQTPQQQGQSPQGQQQPQMSPAMSPTNTPKFDPSKSDPSRDPSSRLPQPRTDLSSDKPLDRGTSTTGSTSKDVSGKASPVPGLTAQGQQTGQNMGRGGMGGMMGGMPHGAGMGGQRGSGKKDKKGAVLSADRDQLGTSTAEDAVVGGILSKETLERKEEVPHIMLIPDQPAPKDR